MQPTRNWLIAGAACEHRESCHLLEIQPAPPDHENHQVAHPNPDPDISHLSGPNDPDHLSAPDPDHPALSPIKYWWLKL